jgi:hypothetical protein
MYLIRLDILASVDITISTVSSILNGTNSLIKGLNMNTNINDLFALTGFSDRDLDGH